MVDNACILSTILDGQKCHILSLPCLMVNSAIYSLYQSVYWIGPYFIYTSIDGEYCYIFSIQVLMVNGAIHYLYHYRWWMVPFKFSLPLWIANSAIYYCHEFSLPVLMVIFMIYSLYSYGWWILPYFLPVSVDGEY